MPHPPSSPVRASWAEFWGEFLLRRFHRDNPDRWPARERKAEWVWRTLALGPAPHLLDLGCGDGVLDIVLARRGARILAVDRLEGVLEGARREAGEAPVEFRVADLRTFAVPPGSFDAALLFEVAGLMSRDEDGALLRRVREGLKPGGQVAVDFPRPPDTRPAERRWSFPEGELVFRSAYDPGSRRIHLQPSFTATDGTRTVLHDPYDPALPDHEGLLRYVYSQAELEALLAQAGFRVRETAHYSSPQFGMLVGEV